MCGLAHLEHIKWNENFVSNASLQILKVKGPGMLIAVIRMLIYGGLKVSEGAHVVIVYSKV